MIDIPYGNRELTDTWLLFKCKEDASEYLEHKSTPVGRFRSCDHIDYAQQSQDSNGIARLDVERLTIKTNSNLEFTREDWIMSTKDQKIWKITDFVVSDDGQNKEFSSRPKKWTFLTLMRNRLDG